MPEAAIVVPKGPSGGKYNGGAYVDRDKPAQIRFSNISAGKGEFYSLHFSFVIEVLDLVNANAN